MAHPATLRRRNASLDGASLTVTSRPALKIYQKTGSIDRGQSGSLPKRWCLLTGLR